MNAPLSITQAYRGTTLEDVRFEKTEAVIQSRINALLKELDELQRELDRIRSSGNSHWCAKKEEL